MAKLPLNPEANAIRNITFSENKEKDHEFTQENFDKLLEQTKELSGKMEELENYKKATKEERERREKIRDLAGDDPEKIGKLKEVLYDNDEEQEESDKYSEVGQGKEQEESIEGLPKSEKAEQKEDSDLLNKPNMTAEDKENMRKSIDQLKELDMYTEENLKKLDAIIYHKDSIEIGGVKRARKNLEAEADADKGIYKHTVNGKEYTYFKRQSGMDEVKKQGMELPTYTQMETSLKALPRDYKEEYNWYKGSNVVGTILGLGDLPGFCDSVGDVNNGGKYSYLWSSSVHNESCAYLFLFSKDEGTLYQYNRDDAFVCRPVIK